MSNIDHIQCNTGILLLVIYTIFKISRKKMKNQQITKVDMGKLVTPISGTVLYLRTYICTRYYQMCTHISSSVHKNLIGF